jgi:hypothetical protein
LLVALTGPSRTGLASAQLPRIGFVLFLDKKNQKSSQKRGFFAALGLCPAGQIKTTGCMILPLCAPGPPHMAKRRYALCQRSRPSVFIFPRPKLFF